MVRTKLFNRNLNKLSPVFEERNNNSPDFINVTFVQDTYTAGKNIFKIKPNYKNIEKNSIDYEILDVNGNTIYHKKLTYIDDDGSSVIAIYIYEDTPIGVASIIFVGKSTVNLQGEGLLPFQNRQNNYRYIHTLRIDKSKRNDSDIIFVNKPMFNVSEKKANVVEEKFANGKLTTLTGTGSYLLINDTPTILEGGSLFSSDMEMGILSFPVLSDNYFPKQSYSINNFAYSSNIKKVISPIQLVLETPLTVSSSTGKDSTIIKGVTKIEKQPYSIQYYKSATERNTTQNSKPYAKIDIQNMEADAGHVSRVKVFSKSSVKPSTEYQLVYDSEIHPKNILIDDTTSLIEYPIGIFNGNTNVVSGPSFFSSSLNALNYWNIVRLNGAPPASKITSSIYLSNSVSVLPSLVMSGSQELMLEQTGSIRTKFWKDTAYKLKFDYYLTKNTLDNRDSKLDVYISGSSFGNNNEFGFYLGSVPTHKGSLSIVRDYTIPILPNFDGDGILRFVMRDGSKIANVRIEENIESGFGVNRTSLYVPIKNEHRLEYLDFKIQFFNYTLKEANKEFEVKDAFFVGGNQYIVGDDNIITGSTFVAPYSSSGIELYGNIAGAKSGSYISSYGYKGIEWAKLYPLTASNYGWSMTQGNPYFSSSYSNATVQLINKSGSLFEFRSNPDSFNMSIVGNNSSVLIGVSSSISQSYLKWDGERTNLGNPLVTDIEFRPTNDPNPTGTYLSSSFLFVSSSNTSLGYDLYFRQDGNLTKWKWIEAELNTGVLYGGTLSYSGSTVYVKSGAGIIVNHNASTTQEVSPIISYTRWSDITSSITNITTTQNTYLYIDTGANLQQQSTAFTPAQYHQYIPLGRVSHYDYTNINSVGSLVETSYDNNGQQNEFVRAFGPLKLSGMVVSGQSGSLRLNVSSGETFNLGGFYQQNQEIPSTYISTTYNTSSIIRIYRSGSGFKFDNNAGSYYTTIDPTKYDTGTGIPQPVGNNNWSVQRVFFNPVSGRSHVYYGQAKYTTLQNAINGIASEPFSESDITAKSYTFIGYLAVLAQSTDLMNTSDNTIVQAGLFRNISGGGGAGGSSTLAALTDVSLGTLSNAEVLKYNSTSGKWENSTVTTASYSINAATASVLSNSGGNITITGGTTYDNLYFGGTASQSFEASVDGVDKGAVNLYFGTAADSRTYRFAWQNDRNVVLYGTGNIALWNTGTATSDYILKRNIKPTEMNGIETLKKLNVIDFEWKDGTSLYDEGKTHTGFVAQEVETIIPDAIYSPSGSTKLLHKEELVPTLVKALQEAVQKIEELEKKLLVSNN